MMRGKQFHVPPPRRTLTIVAAKTCFANALAAEVDAAR